MSSRSQKFDIIKKKKKKKKKHAYLSVSAVMFCKFFLAYTLHIDWCYHSIHKHSCRSQHKNIIISKISYKNIIISKISYKNIIISKISYKNIIIST